MRLMRASHCKLRSRAPAYGSAASFDSSANSGTLHFLPAPFGSVGRPFGESIGAAAKRGGMLVTSIRRDGVFLDESPVPVFRFSDSELSVHSPCPTSCCHRRVLARVCIVGVKAVR